MNKRQRKKLARARYESYSDAHVAQSRAYIEDLGYDPDNLPEYFREMGGIPLYF